ncbi:hypothetical protein EZJ19_10215 [Parasulfuritortus cantonensis]|uniref:Uncharacterized protein n=1 Tax=Parasulfuritortus cantonensis TaxID=2528202 RepID=A0A4V2NVG6_9PROT|nr:hypothetical protein EZJ19_10215 [Parasulfuritortus cantonensis]
MAHQPAPFGEPAVLGGAQPADVPDQGAGAAEQAEQPAGAAAQAAAAGRIVAAAEQGDQVAARPAQRGPAEREADVVMVRRQVDHGGRAVRHGRASPCRGVRGPAGARAASARRVLS